MLFNLTEVPLGAFSNKFDKPKLYLEEMTMLSVISYLAPASAPKLKDFIPVVK